MSPKREFSSIEAQPSGILRPAAGSPIPCLLAAVIRKEGSLKALGLVMLLLFALESCVLPSSILDPKTIDPDMAVIHINSSFDKSYGVCTVMDGAAKVGEIKAGERQLEWMRPPGFANLSIKFSQKPEANYDDVLVVCLKGKCVINLDPVFAGFCSSETRVALALERIPEVADRIGYWRKEGRRAAEKFLNDKIEPESMRPALDTVGTYLTGLRFLLDGENPSSAWTQIALTPKPGGRGYWEDIPGTLNRAYKVEVETKDTPMKESFDENKTPLMFYTCYSRPKTLSSKKYSFVATWWSAYSYSTRTQARGFTFKLTGSAVDKVADLLGALFVFISPKS